MEITVSFPQPHPSLPPVTQGHTALGCLSSGIKTCSRRKSLLSHLYLCLCGHSSWGLLSPYKERLCFDKGKLVINRQGGRGRTPSALLKPVRFWVNTPRQQPNRSGLGRPSLPTISRQFNTVQRWGDPVNRYVLILGVPLSHQARLDRHRRSARLDGIPHFPKGSEPSAPHPSPPQPPAPLSSPPPP